MDLNQIRYYLALAQSLNFTEAARQTSVAQPSLTRAIQRLEEELGGRLVHRDGKDSRLTALGRDVQAEFIRIQASLDRVRSLADASVAGQASRLVIGVPSTIAPGATAAFWRHVLVQLPLLDLHFSEIRPADAEAALLSGARDLCLLTDPPGPNPKLKVQPLFREVLQLGVGADHPLAARARIAPQDLSEQVYIDRLHCEFRTLLIRHFMDRDIVMRPRFTSEREDWVQQMVAGGAGVCMLPQRSVIVPGVVLRPVEGLDIGREVCLASVSGPGTAREVRQIMTLAARFDWQAAPAAGGMPPGY